MARRSVGRSAILGVFARRLQALGVRPGAQLPREAFDDLVMVGCEVGPDSITNYLAQGKAYGYWTVQEKHGRGGRGTVTFLGLDHDGAVPGGIDDAPAVAT